MNKIKIDIVIPVYNEAENIEAVGYGSFLVLMINDNWRGIITKGNA